jgi:hypothetical protein
MEGKFMAYPNAFCVKCGAHTETLKKHTVVLGSQARALKGVCPRCESDVYKFLPKGKKFKFGENAKDSLYPDAFCVKCQDHKPTLKAHTVVLGNKSRALTGECASCGSEVYRILTPKKEAMAKQVVAPSDRRNPNPETAPGAQVEQADKVAYAQQRLGQRVVRARELNWMFYVGVGFIIGTILGFITYTLA